jgi:3',5'-cyclic AMP phosphodiesterase CpdA
MANQNVYFVHISDTHIGPSPEFTVYGIPTLPALESVVNTINGLKTKPDFVVHSGDIVDDARQESYRVAAQVLAKLTVPIYYVTGNHDRARYIKAQLPSGEYQSLVDGDDTLAYAFEVKGNRFITLDARGPDEIDPSGLLPTEQLVLLEEELHTATLPVTVFIHFPPAPLDSPWLDRDMLLINGEHLHRVLTKAQPKLRGVFFGHLHRNLQVFRDGILYSTVGSTFCQFTAWPTDEKATYELHCPAFFNFVTLTQTQTIIKEQFTYQPPARPPEE